jgi:arylsulfatase A-like enzyme
MSEMLRRTFLAAGSALAAASPQTTARPNIVVLMADQQRYDSIGANGNPLVRTPNFDRLAAESANFSHCFVQAPVCVPSRITFQTGRYPHSHRNRVNYTPLDRDEKLIQQYLSEAG